MARQAIKSYAIDPAHTNDSHAIDRAQSNRLRIVSVCGGYITFYFYIFSKDKSNQCYFLLYMWQNGVQEKF